MVRYNLSLYIGKKQYQEILWSDIPNFNDYDAKTLINIDWFTSLYQNEDELKGDLIKFGVICLNDFNKKLCITYKNSGITKKTGYGLAYECDKKFLDEGYILYYLESSLDNISLLEKLCNRYQSSHVQGNNIVAIRTYLNKVKQDAELTAKDAQNISDIINNFFMREVYAYDLENSCYKCDENGNPITKYKGIHDLGMFLAHDYRKRFPVAQINTAKDVSTLNDDVVSEEKCQVKKLVKKKKQTFEGQMNMFE
jgi:hypothetical protein